MYVYSHNLFLVNICTYAHGYVLQVCLLVFSVYVVKSVEMNVTSAAEREGVLIEVRGSHGSFAKAIIHRLESTESLNPLAQLHVSLSSAQPLPAAI